MGLISLTTDFGTRDEYVGVMKAVIWGIAPRVQIVDISHAVPPQDLHAAAFLLKAAYPYFEAGSVHVVVVDPGVGSRRRIVALRLEGHGFILPDNGLVQLILAGRKPTQMVHLSRPEFYLPQVSGTFHGRDIFAPVAAHLASGQRLEQLGSPLSLEALVPAEAPPSPQSGPGFIKGHIVQVDRFGNLTTDIERRQLEAALGPSKRPAIQIHIGLQIVVGLSACYADAPVGQPLALFGSRDLLEIAVNQGHAEHFFKVRRGDEVRLEW